MAVGDGAGGGGGSVAEGAVVLVTAGDAGPLPGAVVVARDGTGVTPPVQAAASIASEHAVTIRENIRGSLTTASAGTQQG